MLKQEVEELRFQLSALQTDDSESEILGQGLSALKETLLEKERKIKSLQIHLDLVIGRHRPCAPPGLPITPSRSPNLRLTAAPDAILVEKTISLESDRDRTVVREEDLTVQIELQRQ